MTDPSRLEPKNGDFVAYLDRLQEESLEALKKSAGVSANAPSPTDPEASPTSLREMAAEVFRQIKPKAVDNGYEPLNPEPVERPQSPLPTSRPVAEIFRNLPQQPAKAPTSRTAETGRAKKQPFRLFIGNVMVMVGVFGFVVAANENIEALAPPMILLAFAGFILSATASKRR